MQTACKISWQNLQKLVPDKLTNQNRPNRCYITRRNTEKEQLYRSEEAELIMAEKLFDI